MSRGVVLIVPSRSDGRVVRPLVSGTAGQRPRYAFPPILTHGGGEATPCRARGDAHTTLRVYLHRYGAIR